jgi:hypothetical protein
MQLVTVKSMKNLIGLCFQHPQVNYYGFNVPTSPTDWKTSSLLGRHSQENYAPFSNDANLHLVLALAVSSQLKAGVFDIETACRYLDAVPRWIK